MIKIILIIFITLIFNNVAYGNTDCSQLKKLSKDYLSCITKRTKVKTSNLGFDASNIKEKKTLADWFKKKK